MSSAPSHQGLQDRVKPLPRPLLPSTPEGQQQKSLPSILRLLQPGWLSSSPNFVFSPVLNTLCLKSVLLLSFFRAPRLLVRALSLPDSGLRRGPDCSAPGANVLLCLHMLPGSAVSLNLPWVQTCARVEVRAAFSLPWLACREPESCGNQVLFSPSFRVWPKRL